MTNPSEDATETATRLNVLSGLHAGSDVIFGETALVVGGDLNSDVVLLDQGIALQHVRLEPKSTSLMVQALAPDVTVNSEDLEVNGTTEVSFPVLIEIGPVALRIDGPAPPALAVIDAFNSAVASVPKRPSFRLPASVIVAIMALAGLVLVVYPFIQMTSDLGSAPTEQPELSMGGAAASMGLPASSLDPEDGAAHLRRDILAAGLQSVTAAAVDGHVEATGTLTPDLQDSWQAIERGFDEKYAGRLLLIDKVAITSAPTAPKLGFEAVSLGEEPFVVIAGRRHKTGSVIDGWSIVAIERARIVIRRGDQSLSLTY
jgi:type III secretion protein D